MSSPCCRFGSPTAQGLGFRVQGSSSGAEGEEIMLSATRLTTCGNWCTADPFDGSEASPHAAIAEV